MDPMEALMMRVSLFDVSVHDLNSDDPEKRTEAVLDAAALLTAAKKLVLDA
jgi:hypothetical protein